MSTYCYTNAELQSPPPSNNESRNGTDSFLSHQKRRCPLKRIILRWCASEHCVVDKGTVYIYSYNTSNWNNINRYNIAATRTKKRGYRRRRIFLGKGLIITALKMRTAFAFCLLAERFVEREKEEVRPLTISSVLLRKPMFKQTKKKTILWVNHSPRGFPSHGNFGGHFSAHVSKTVLPPEKG